MWNASHASTFIVVVASTPRFSDDYPYATFFYLAEDAAGNTDVDAILVMDGISDARVSPPLELKYLSRWRESRGIKHRNV